MPGAFNIGVQYKGTEECSGILTVRNCTLRPATVTYKVVIDGNASSIALEGGSTVSNNLWEQYTDTIPMTEAEIRSNFNVSTYGGLFRLLSDTYSSSLHMVFWPLGLQILNQGSLPSRYLNTSELLKNLDCSMWFNDPMDDIIAAIQELMFRTAVASANGTQAAHLQSPRAR